MPVSNGSIGEEMNLAKACIDYISYVQESGRLLRWPKTVLPFVAFAAVQCLVLFALAFFLAKPISPVTVPLVERLAGEQALHYPMHFVLLPQTYRILYLLLVISIGFSLFGAAVFNMIDVLTRSQPLPTARPRLVQLVPSMIVIGFAHALVAELTLLGTSYLAEPLGKRVGVYPLLLVRLGLVTFIQALLVYSLAMLRRVGPHPIAAIAASARFALKHFYLTALIVLTVLLVHLPIDFLLGQPDKIVLKFRPELVFALLLVGILVEIATSFFMYSTTTMLATKKEALT
jgi:hypothetical protein